MPIPLSREAFKAELALLRAQLNGLPLMHRAITVLQQEVRAVRNDIAFIRAHVATPQSGDPDQSSRSRFGEGRRPEVQEAHKLGNHKICDAESSWRER